MRAFQKQRGLAEDGTCTRETWGRLVEAGFSLGDRLLYLRSPMQRGDDVAELQERLGSLGFDAGRVDGIFGPRTAEALGEFQRNMGLPSDGRCGRATVAELRRLRTPEHATVAGLREREALRRRPETLFGARVAVAHFGGLGALVESVRRSLLTAGAAAVILQHPDGSHLAAQANLLGARAFLAFAADPRLHGCCTAYYASYRWESPAGRRLAEDLGERVPEVLAVPTLGARGMSLPLLRETRMPAILCEVGPTAALVQNANPLAAAVTDVLVRWLPGS